MNLAKTSLLNGMAVLIKLATTLILNKVLAMQVGPGGYAVIGQFQNLLMLIAGLTSGALNNGVVKYTAELADAPVARSALWRTATMLSFGAAGTCCVLLIALRGPLAGAVLGDRALSSVLVWLGLAVVLMAANGLMLAVMNGLKLVSDYVLATILGGVITATAATVLVLSYGLQGALIALAIGPALAFGPTLWLLTRNVQIEFGTLLGRVDLQQARRLGAFALMGLTSAICIPLSHVYIRNGIATESGWHQAGLWQALWKISETHLMLLSTTLSLYFLPRYAEIKDGAELRREVYLGYRFVIPLVVLSSSILWWQRETLVAGLLSSEFLPITSAMGLQFLGDVLKIGSWVMAFTMLSHAQTRIYIVSEIATSALLAWLTVHLAARHGLQGAAAAYALTYLAYWICMWVVFSRLCKFTLASRLPSPPADIR